MNPRGLGRDTLSDDALLARLTDQIGKSRHVEAQLVALIAEVDARRLYLREACRSMHAYLTERLHLSDAETYLRITVARLSRRFPIIVTMLTDGRLHLSGVAKLAPHVPAENGEAVLTRAAHLSKRQLDILIAELSPQPDAPSRIRRLPDRSAVSVPSSAGSLVPGGVVSGDAAPDGAPAGAAALGAAASSDTALGDLEAHTGRPSPSSSAPAAASGWTGGPSVRTPATAAAATVTPTAPGRYKVQFTAGADLRDKIARAQSLLRHQIPDGDLAEVVDRAMTLLVRELERAKFAATSSPRKSAYEVDPTPSSRAVPAPIRRAVWARDGGQCTFRGPRGERCSATERLEFHHIIPFARGGDHSEANVFLACAAHNAYQAELDFGPHMLRGPAAKPSAPHASRLGREAQHH